MRDRHSLLVRRLPIFKEFLNEQEIEWREGKGEYQVMQIKWPEKWNVIYRRKGDLESWGYYSSVTVPEVLKPLVKKYVKAKGWCE